MPSKKVLSLLILSSAIVAVVIIVSGQSSGSPSKNMASALRPGEKIAIADNPNWQSDFSKINQNITQSESSSTQSGSVTDTVSTSLMSNYLALKQNGLLDNTSAQKLVDQTVNLADKLGTQNITSATLRVIPDNGAQTMYEYGDSLGNVFRSNKPTEIKNEVEIITSAINQKDSSKIGELDGIISVYQNIENDLLKMPVPQTFAKAHLDMVSGLEETIVALKEMKNVFKDPIKSLEALKIYQDGIVKFTGAKRATNNFLLKNNIVYKQGSGGYYLIYGI